MVQANDLPDLVAPQVRSLVEALYSAVRRAHRLRTTRVHSTCDKAGLVLLGQLVELGPMRLSELAATVQLDVSTVSRQVRDLCKGGFAEALEDPDDRRARLLQVSRTGRAEVESVKRELGAAVGAAVADWPDTDVDHLTSLLTRLADDLGAASGAADQPARST
jgi:DNA-binding MarR family transcriptional regulator